MHASHLPAGLTVTGSLIIEAAQQRSPNMQVVVDTFLAASYSDSARTEEPELQTSDALRFVLKCCVFGTYVGHGRSQVHEVQAWWREQRTLLAIAAIWL